MSSTWTKQHKAHTASSKTRMSNLNIGSVALALLPVDAQAELLAHLTDLRSALSEEDPQRLALLSLIHIGCQVIQQLCEETEIFFNITSTESDGSLSKDNFEKHFNYARFHFLVTTIKTWGKKQISNYCSKIDVRSLFFCHFIVIYKSAKL